MRTIPGILGSRRVTIRGMGHAEPDIAELFAPLRPAQAFEVVLNEAREVLAHVRSPIDAELWGSDMIGALSGSGGTARDGAVRDGAARDGTAWDSTGVMAELAVSLVPAAEKTATPEALALLRILGALGSPPLRAAATEAANRVHAGGVPNPVWAARLGAPTVGRCWHYGDTGGRQESVTATFGYGDAQHALSVLIDHGRHGRIRDAWVDDADGLIDKTWLAAETDPLVVFEEIDPADARARLEKAIAAGECPVKPDEADDLTAHRAFLHARVRLLAAN
jgi:hypothetical protein